VVELHAEPGTVLAVGAPLITIAGGESVPLNGSATGGTSAGADAGSADAAGEQYRDEERAGTTAPDDSPERPLIGYGAGDGPARSTGGRRRRAATPPATSGAQPGRAVRVISPLVRKLA